MLNSTISWLDFSESERRRTIEVISLFQDRETRDELGLGSIRDGFANDLFPGTTTLQTRARYFLLVPWLYRSYEKKGVTSEKINDRLRRDEISLIDTLKHAGEEGVIGQRSGVGLHRFPSSIYWVGLQEWGICRFPGTQDQYHRSLNRWHDFHKQRSQNDEEPLDHETGNNWNPNLPDSPADLLTASDLTLTAEEAGYLRDCLLLNCTDSLLTYLVENTRPVDESAQFPWHHPQIGGFPQLLRTKLEHARNFSETLYGAALLYNFLLSEKRNDEGRILTYQHDLNDWWTRIDSRRENWNRWNQGAFWDLAKSIGRIPFTTERFVNQWLSLLFENGKIARPEKNKKMRVLIEERERHLKGSRSRFTSPRHLEIWRGAASTGQIEYRWRIARRMVNDILIALGKRKGNQHARTG